jgi:hypothetical protein
MYSLYFKPQSKKYLALLMKQRLLEYVKENMYHTSHKGRQIGMYSK